MGQLDVCGLSQIQCERKEEEKIKLSLGLNLGNVNRVSTTWTLYQHLKVHIQNNKPAAQAAGQTLPVGKIHPFNKIALTFEPIQQFRCPSRFKISGKMLT